MSKEDNELVKICLIEYFKERERNKTGIEVGLESGLGEILIRILKYYNYIMSKEDNELVKICLIEYFIITFSFKMVVHFDLNNLKLSIIYQIIIINGTCPKRLILSWTRTCPGYLSW